MNGGRKVSKADLLELARVLGDDQAHEGESMVRIFQSCLDRARELAEPASTYPVEPYYVAHPIVRDWARRVVDGAVEHVLSCRMGDNEAERFAAGWVDSAVRRHAAIDPATCSHTMRLGRCIRCGQQPPAGGGSGPSVDEVIDLMHREPLPKIEAECRGRGHNPGPCIRDSREAVCRWCTRAMPEAPACEHAGELAIDRATGEESCTDCDESEEPTLTEAPPVDDLKHLRPEAHADRVRALLAEPPSWRSRTYPFDQNVETHEVLEPRERAERWAKTRGSRGAERTA